MSQEVKNYFVVSLIASIIGVGLILFSDFAGFYNYSQSVQTYGYIFFSLDTPIVAFLILIVAMGLLFSAYVSYLGMQGEANSNMVKNGFYSVVISLGIIIAGGLIFVVVMLSDEPTDWWFGTGFYGGLITTAVSSFFLYKATTEA